MVSARDDECTVPTQADMSLSAENEVETVNHFRELDTAVPIL
jgi:hypothetical protein